MKKVTKVTKPSDTKSATKKKTCSEGKACVSATTKKASPKTTTSKNTGTQKATPVSAAKAPLKMTRIVAHINVGWGNMLYIRGEGAGLSWEQGVPMLCHDGSEWHWIAETEEGPISFKFLINDEKWALGENVTINAGDVHISDPSF